MNIKNLLFGSAVALTVLSSAHAADTIVVAEPEPVEYVRVCDAYGAGYFYIPGTQTCMRISGYVRADLSGGDHIDARRHGDIKRDTYDWMARATLRLHTASETELGTLRTLVELRSDWSNGTDGKATGQLRKGFIELGGLRVGMDDSIFDHWTGYYGNIINDDILNPVDKRTNVISYTFNAGNGFSAILGVEQGNNDSEDYGVAYRYGWRNSAEWISKGRKGGIIDDYAPNVVGGVKYVQGWGGLSVVVGYDSRIEEWAGKARLDVNVTDQFSLWAMAGYKSGDDYYYKDRITRNHDGSLATRYFRAKQSQYGDWSGDWAAWIGGTYKFTAQTSFNFQAAYDDSDTFAASVNIAHELVPGLSITPELTYISWENDWKVRNDLGQVIKSDTLKGKDAFQGMVRLQRSF